MTRRGGIVSDIGNVAQRLIANISNPSIKAALSRWTAMKARGIQAAAWDDPRVSANFNAARFVEVPPNAFMDQAVTLEQMIPISGKNRVRSRIARAEALAEMA